MNKIRIEELTTLNINYHSGSTKEILYRCTLIGPFVLAMLPEFPEYKKEKIIQALSDWFDICDENNLYLIESLIELYNFDTINNTPISLYEDYPEIFERMVDYLLGKTTWEPDKYNKDVAVNCSNNLTAQLLEHIYLNK